ncbi:MAG: response regulator [Pseudomonadota bacterium]
MSSPQVEFLIRTNGAQSLVQIRASMPELSQDDYDAIVREMINQKLVTPVVVDPVESNMQASLNLLTKTPGTSAVDSGVSSLETSGFYVEIARARGERRIRDPGDPLSAIVVEDEPTLAKFIQTYLGFEGFNVRLAGNRAKIRAEFGKLPVPDVVLLDVQLPDADGFDILSRLRTHKTFGDVPVIMLTGKATRAAVLKGMAAGADGYVTKPFEAESLIHAVQTVVGLKQAPKTVKTQDPWVNRNSSFWKG